MVLVRKVGRRSIAAGGHEHERLLGVRMVGLGAFLPLMVVLLAYQKAACHFGVWPRRVAAALLALPVVALLAAGLRTKEVVSLDHEERLEPEEVTRQLASLELSVQDLIHEDGWKSLSESLRFADAANAQMDLLAARARRRMAVKIVVGVVVAIALLLAATSFGEWFQWLAKDDC